MLWTPTHDFKLPKQPVMEEYYGTPTNIAKALRYLTKIVDDINKSTELELIKADYISWKENLEIQKLFEREFGFKEQYIYWLNETVPNAYTIVGGTIINSNPGITSNFFKDKKAKYYDNRHSYICNVTVITALVKNMQLTPRETMGIILHEIGHNFDNLWTTAFSWITHTLFGGFLISEVLRYIFRWELEGKALMQKHFPVFFRVLDLLTTMPYHLNVINVPNLTLMREIIAGALPFSLITGTRSEYFADSFAAKYGFGPDLATATAKFSDARKSGGYAKRAVYQVPILRTMLDIVNGPIELFLQIFDPHPTDENRVLSIRQNLVNDLNDPDVPKNFKPEIRRQIETIDNRIKMDQEDAIKSGLYFQALRKFVTYNCPLKDFYHR